jgi:hypothetical protein
MVFTFLSIPGSVSETQDLENAHSDLKMKSIVEDMSRGIEMEMNYPSRPTDSPRYSGKRPTTYSPEESIKLDAPGYRTFKEVSEIMLKKYNNQENIHSTALDIVSIYLKGQKILHIESKLYCEYYLYRLMLPAIFISTLSSVISGILKDSANASIAVCLLTAANSFILALVTYLKLDAKSEAHRISAYSFEKLQSLCEFKSGKILLTKSEDLNTIVSDFLEEIEGKYKEIKEGNQFIIPETIQLNFPFLYYTNIFSKLKVMRNEEMIQINKLKVVMNQGADIQNAIMKAQQEIQKRKDMIQTSEEKVDPSQKETDKLPFLESELIYWYKQEQDWNTKREKHYIEKNQEIENFLNSRNTYYKLNDTFNDEITNQNDIIKKRSYNLCACLKT